MHENLPVEFQIFWVEVRIWLSKNKFIIARSCHAYYILTNGRPSYLSSSTDYTWFCVHYIAINNLFRKKAQNLLSLGPFRFNLKQFWLAFLPSSVFQNEMASHLLWFILEQQYSRSTLPTYYPSFWYDSKNGILFVHKFHEIRKKRLLLNFSN